MMGVMALTRADQREAVDLLRRVLAAVERGESSADGPAAVAVMRRLEGALLAVEAVGRSGRQAGDERQE